MSKEEIQEKYPGHAGLVYGGKRTKELLLETFGEEKLARFSTATSNKAFHYMGAAKIIAPIGEAFAEALIETRSGNNPQH